MAEISKITIPNGNTYEFKDTKAHYYGECSTAAATAAKTVSILDFTASELVSGITIRVKFIYANTVASPTLNINSLGAKPIYRYGTTAPSTSAATSWQAGSIVALTYDGTGWILNSWLNDNTTYSVMGNLVHANGSFVANSAIYRCQLLFHVDDDTLTPLNNVSNGYDNTSKAILTSVAFDPFAEIYYYATTTAVAANAAIAATYLSYAYGTVDLRYSLNISASVNALTAHKDVYMKVAPQSDGKVKLATAFPLVQTLPTTNDGYWYIYLGRAYSTYQISLYDHHEVYTHNGTSLIQVLPQDAIATTTTAGLMSANDKSRLDSMTMQTLVKKKVTITIPSGSTSITYNDAWITEDTDCYAHDLSTKNVSTTVSWEFGPGSVAFTLGESQDSALSFEFGMMKMTDPGNTTSEPVARKKITVTILAGTTPNNLVTCQDNWITADTDCYAHDLATKNVNTTISWMFYDGGVTFQIADKLDTDLVFGFGMIK